MKRAIKPNVSYEAWERQQFAEVEAVFQKITGRSMPANVTPIDTRKAPVAPTQANFRIMLDELVHKAEAALDCHCNIVFSWGQGEKAGVARELLRSTLNALQTIQRFIDDREDDD